MSSRAIHMITKGDVHCDWFKCNWDKSSMKTLTHSAHGFVAVDASHIPRTTGILSPLGGLKERGGWPARLEV